MHGKTFQHNAKNIKEKLYEKLHIVYGYVWV